MSSIKPGQTFRPIGPMRVIEVEDRDGEQWCNVQFEMWDEELRKNVLGTCWVPAKELSDKSPENLN